MVHIRCNGKSCDVLERDLGLVTTVTTQVSDQEIRQAVARYLDLDMASTRELVVDRTPKGDVILRPEAVFG